MENIIAALRELGIEIYHIEETAKESLECYFVRKNLDLKRSTQTRGQKVTVYQAFEKNGQKMLGSSTVQIHPGMGEEETRHALREAYFAAGLVCNAYYELPAGRKEEPAPPKGGFAGRGLEESARLMAEALYAEDTQPDVFINSAEIFIRRWQRRIVNSAGVDVSYQTDWAWGEYVIQCPAPQDVETYHQFNYREPDTEDLRRAVWEALEMTKARAQAVSAPATGEYALILSGKHVEELMRFYLGRSGSAMVYQKYSSFAVGDNVQGEDVQGDKLTIELKALDPYSLQGIPMKDRPLLENGVLKTIHGGSRFAYYLGIEPTGEYESIRVATGSSPMEALKSGKYLHVVSFSDFQMNALSGHFGGEIRLAFLCDGETVTPVTGGSVNGSILEAQKHMKFSTERYRSASYDGPLAVRIEGVKVAGV